MAFSSVIHAAGIEPKVLVPGWPVRNAAREVPWAVIAEKAAAEHPSDSRGGANPK